MKPILDSPQILEELRSGTGPDQKTKTESGSAQIVYKSLPILFKDPDYYNHYSLLKLSLLFGKKRFSY
ncbi:hypothetical protein L2E82_27814 [Cichorium intybus]|uniref:Uncharacterized protein n=1 Tax=Cichorium intybus TaxID=13427 RepID=A0ACB9CUP0_CICIN|nr:hypothetical protein L2E82_27814 [Cichorium intybus]